MSPLLIDSGIETCADLAGLLPEDVRGRIEPELLTESPTAASLRVLATIRDPRWRDFVGAARIDWDGLLAWARGSEAPSRSVVVRVEFAASLAGYFRADVQLRAMASALDSENFYAVIDALRIAREGLAR